MLPRLRKTKHPSSPWLVVYTDPTIRVKGRPKRYRFHFADPKAAEAKLKELSEEAGISGVTGLTFDSRLRADAMATRQALDVGGHTGVSLMEVAREWMRQRAGPVHSDWLLETVYNDFVEYKEREGLKARSLANLKTRISRWIKDRKLVRLRDIDESNLLALKNRKGVSAQTRSNDMGAVSSFLTYLADERKVIPANPLLVMARPHTDNRVPRVLDPEQVRRLLEAARTTGGGRLLRYFTLCLWAGLRPTEAAQVDPRNVTFGREGSFVRVILSKRRRRMRSVPLSAGFKAWWKVAPETPMPLFDQTRDRDLFDDIRDAAGLIERNEVGARRKISKNHWQGDICRHTWISVRLVETKSEDQVALEAGTSVDMIHEHYLDWLTPKQVKAITAIRPAKVTAPPSDSVPGPAQTAALAQDPTALPVAE